MIVNFIDMKTEAEKEVMTLSKVTELENAPDWFLTHFRAGFSDMPPVQINALLCFLEILNF